LGVEEIKFFVVVTIDGKKSLPHSRSTSGGGSLRIVRRKIYKNLIQAVLY
jgi:hypothetical protein